jgi:enoyl-CoA hydratase/carnithine racemase
MREISMVFETLKVTGEETVLFTTIAAPPMNLFRARIGPRLSLAHSASRGRRHRQGAVFKSADPDYFIAHVDVTQIKEYRAEAAKLIGEASIGLMFRHLSASRLVTIVQIEGRVRAAGSEFVLECNMRFAARESAIFSRPKAAPKSSPSIRNCAQRIRAIPGIARRRGRLSEAIPRRRRGLYPSWCKIAAPAPNATGNARHQKPAT